MYLPRITRCGLVLFACLLTCAGTTWTPLDAQSATRSYNARNRAISSRYQPRFMQNAQAPTNQQVPSNGNAVQPIILDNVNNGQIGGGPVGEVIVADGGYFDGGYVDGGFTEDGCSDCGDGTRDSLYDPRDCAIADDCWLNGFGTLLRNTEYFTGVQGFKHQVFEDPQGQPQPENAIFGYHIGFNTGLPLYKLTCGVVSGQFGVNFVRSNLNSGVLAEDERRQTFITAGLFRRVDYGLQFGAVADMLNSQYATDLELVQIRSELSWVWSGGSNFGFRHTKNVQDGSALVGGAFVPVIYASAIDTYRLFYRIAGCNGGYAECYLGRSDEQHTVIGADYDLPLTERAALYASFNYLNPDDEIRLTDNEAWNIQLGITYRPRGRNWYKFYHRPLFKVADNGILVQSRRP